CFAVTREPGNCLKAVRNGFLVARTRLGCQGEVPAYLILGCRVPHRNPSCLGFVSLPVQAEATFWEAPRTERNFRESLGSGLSSSSSSGVVPGPGPAAPIHRGGPAVEGAVSWSSSTGVGGEPLSRRSTHWDDPHFTPRFDNSTDRNVRPSWGSRPFCTAGSRSSVTGR
ncbi:unnamed protein product, partial [Ixodes persulcatus]